MGLSSQYELRWLGGLSNTVDRLSSGLCGLNMGLLLSVSLRVVCLRSIAACARKSFMEHYLSSYREVRVYILKCGRAKFHIG